jgi:hypothetical protein
MQQGSQIAASSIYNRGARPHARATTTALQFDGIVPEFSSTMAELFSLTGLYILLGVLGGLAVLGAVVWAARRATGQHGSANEAGDEKREGLLSEDAVVIAVADSGDAQLCAICKGRLEGPCGRLRPCGHLYHAECIDLWLERKRICPLCRAGVVALRTETVDAMV